MAGRKDRVAVTRQWISAPAPDPDAAREALATLDRADLEILETRPHPHKLRLGHLRANRFVVVLRELELAGDEALRRVEAKLEALAARGLRNYYGGQRFGAEGRNLEPGLAALAGRRRRRPAKGDFAVSAGQSALFNLYLAERAERGLLGTVLVGDIVQKRDSGGIFECSAEERADTQARLDAGELVVTGPMFGSRYRRPPAESPAGELEEAILRQVGLKPGRLAKLGRSVPGARRALRIWPKSCSAALVPAVDELGPGLELRFELPPGSYATVFMRELQR